MGCFLFGAGFFLPFVESGGGHDATAFLEGGAEAGFFGNGLAACIEQGAGSDFFGPVRHESPAHGVEMVAFFVSEDDRDGLGGGDVEAWHDAGGIFADEGVSAKDGLHDGGLGESSAHGLV